MSKRRDTSTPASLTWRQVNAWRLAQHGLSQRFRRRDLVQALTRTGGIQAQVMSAAELALWARVEGITPQDVQAALWQKRTFVKTWAMRAALHLVAASDLPLYVAARNAHEARNWFKYFDFHDITREQTEAFIAAIPLVLGDVPMTRVQIADAISENLGVPGMRKAVLASGWGSPLKPSAWRGDLCFGPSQGQNVTFVRPSQWLGHWQSFAPLTALQEIGRRYLRAYGPATPECFARWWNGGGGIVPAKQLFESLADELVAVDVEGWQAFALRTTLKPMQNVELTHTVRLLPLFDAYVLGLAHHIEPILPKAFKVLVFRPQGWISAVVLVDGYIRGVWEYASQRTQTSVKVRMFAPPPASVRKGIAAEAERLSAFMNTKVVLVFQDAP